MAKKNTCYVDMNHKENGIYTNWSVCAQLKAKGGTNFKGFASREEAQAFISGTDLKNTSVSENSNTEIQKIFEEVTRECIIKNINNCEMNSDCSDVQKQILNSIADSIALNRDYDLTSVAAELEELYETHKDVDAVIFADGSADKGNGQSKKIGIGLVLIDIKEKSIQAYGHRYNDDTEDDMDWVFKGSNDSAEMIVAISSMRLSKTKGYQKIRIYQDNVRPLSYFYGLFKKVNTPIGVWFLEESKNILSDIDVKFIYVPAHNKKDGYDSAGKNDCLEKLRLNTAKKFNDVVDDLANVKL